MILALSRLPCVCVCARARARVRACVWGGLKQVINTPFTFVYFIKFWNDSF
jgi:hypothetical protein